ncbi:hypothetical protein JCM30471_16960 [Desulfuromonas carbonis]|uniref:carbohydrate deacetylase n=1 Tax=Desulfuromonas sp. DDH964 TaxID=1823759 RepID=UPI00082A824F|nr:ChbG/HpnK family deacetylase [Desulfuromonas sp. DDH964]
MIRLIINADDLGSGPGRDRGILRAFRDGVVTSASLLANGPSFESAARAALEGGLPVGVHLNCSEGEPLAGPIAGLTDPRGAFPGKIELRRRLAAGTLPLPELRRELRAQLERTLATGLRPDHLDSHQHCGLFPAICRLLIELASEYRIPALRLPLPAEPAAADPAGELGAELALYRQLAPAACASIRAAGLFIPDGLWGMPLLDRLDLAALTRLLTELPAGNWELMVHPGEPDPGHPFSGPQRLAELAALCAPELRPLIASRGIELTSFGACACAS